MLDGVQEQKVGNKLTYRLYGGNIMEVMTLERFQISLAAARVNAGLTQEAAAKKMSISKNTLVNWEKGKFTRPGRNSSHRFRSGGLLAESC